MESRNCRPTEKETEVWQSGSRYAWGVIKQRAITRLCYIHSQNKYYAYSGSYKKQTASPAWSFSDAFPMTLPWLHMQSVNRKLYNWPSLNKNQRKIKLHQERALTHLLYRDWSSGFNKNRGQSVRSEGGSASLPAGPPLPTQANVINNLSAGLAGEAEAEAASAAWPCRDVIDDPLNRRQLKRN